MLRARHLLLLAIAALLLLVAVVGLVREDEEERPPVPPPAPVTAELETVLQDDALMLFGDDVGVGKLAKRLAAMGVDRVRITAGWSALAPGADRPTRPRFDARDPSQYPPEPFSRLDRAVKEVRRAGMQVMLDLAFWAPRWAVTRFNPGLAGQRWAPSVREFGIFSEAVVRRYSGRFPDPLEPGQKLPAVRLWTTWNEPNHPVFLLPQWVRRGGRWVMFSPHHYRAMHEASYAAIKRVDGRNRVLIGGLTSLGSRTPGTGHSIPPLAFLRELACVDERLQPLQSAECRDFRPLRADGFSHHPYLFSRPPDAPTENPDSVGMGDLPRLSGLLAELNARGRIETRLPIWLTEFGYETTPDPFRGVSPETQALYMSEATYIAWQRPDVRSFAQFLLQDIAPKAGAPPGSRQQWNTYQTGLLFHTGQPKTSLQGFELPLWVTFRPGGREVLVFGQVRPDSGRQHVTIEGLASNGSWTAVPSRRATGTGPTAAEFRTDAGGFYLRTLAVGAASYRARWTRPDGNVEFSLPVTPAL